MIILNYFQLDLIPNQNVCGLNMNNSEVSLANIIDLYSRYNAIGTDLALFLGVFKMFIKGLFMS